MKLTKIINKQNILLAIFLILFSLSYTTNIFRISEANLFHGFERQPEGLVVGRLARSAQDGVFSYGGLTGINHDSKSGGNMEQYAIGLAAQHDLYITNKELPDSYKAYKSQSGGQGIVFSLMHKVLPFDNAKKLAFFRGINALLIALIFCLFGGWVYRNYGFIASFITLLLILASPWLNMFSHNLWWVLWNFYLPFLTMLLALEYKNKYPEKISDWKILALLFGAVFVKCFFSGFEFITTTLVSATCPIVYYAIKRKDTFLKFFFFSAKASIAMLAAVAAQMLVLVTQIKFVEGTLADGVNHITSSFSKRTEFSTDDTPMSYGELFKTYLQDDAFQLGFLSNNMEFYFGILLLIALLAGIFLYLKSKKYRPLVISAAFSLLAPLSWLLVFKQHAVIHIHMDHIIWYIPTLLYGFCTIGIAISTLLEKVAKKNLREKVSLKS